MSANLFGTSKTPGTSLDISASVTGTKKTPEQIAAEAEEKRKKAAGEDGIEMKDMKKMKDISKKEPPRMPFYNNSFNPNPNPNAGGRRRKSRRGKSRKYKRTLKRRKNKTKNRK